MLVNDTLSALLMVWGTSATICFAIYLVISTSFMLFNFTKGAHNGWIH